MCERAHIHSCSRVYTRVRACVHVSVRVCACMSVYVRACVRVCVRAFPHAGGERIYVRSSIVLMRVYVRVYLCVRASEPMCALPCVHSCQRAGV